MEKIAFICDIHLDEQFPLDNNVDPKANWERIVDDLLSRNIRHVVFGGDIGSPTAYPWFFETLKTFSVKLILGNHDHAKPISEYFWQGDDQNELYYQFEDANRKFIFLDTSSEEISEKQLNWLKTASNTGKRIVLFVHHPVLGIETPIDKKFPLKNRDQLKMVLETCRQEITLFCGHYHMNDDKKENNIRQVVTHASSFQIQKHSAEIKVDSSTFGYRLVDFGKENIETTLVEFNNPMQKAHQ